MKTGSVAVVGMAGRFPGASSVAELWALLDQEREATRWLTDEELLAAGVAASTLSDPNYIRASLILPDMEMFDAEFFGFSPREAAILDPQHRHFFECAWEALEDAGHMPERFEGSVGVFAGCGMQAYLVQNLLSNPDLLDTVGLFLLRHTGNDKDFLPTRLSYLLNLRGPSVAVQTACSTSLVAIHMACQSLVTGCCDMALAGGVSIELPHRRGYRFVEGEILSPDGHCRAFDDDARGTLFGSGAGVVVLRRLEDAIASRDNIHLVIRGSAINNDGAQKAGYLAPSVEGQAQAAAEALAMADVDPSSVAYIETHGTGTAVGDPIELAALAQAYSGRNDGGPCGIGSIKTNIGHLDTAAGVASLIKVALAMRHRKIPASLNYRRANARFDFAANRFYVVDRGEPWLPIAHPRRAAVNSLGVGGTNAHVIVEEPPAPTSVPASDWQVVTLSARSPAALQRLRDKWRLFTADPPQDFSLANAAFTTHTGRRAFDHRCAVIARDIDGLRAALTERDTRWAIAGVSAADPRVVFMFPGGGAQYPGAGRELYQRVPAFREAVDECFAVMPPAVPTDLRHLMFECAADDGEAARTLEQPARALSALFVLEYAFAALWRRWGVLPEAVIGHSAGEYAAAVVAGVMSVGDALAVVALRGQIFERMEPGGMLSVQMPEARLCALLGSELDLAAVNDRELCVVSGRAVAVENLQARLSADGIESRRVRINVAAHSRLLDPHLDTFRAGLEAIRLSPPRLRFVSTLAGKPAAESLASADYWIRHLRRTVRFAEGLDAVLEEPRTVLVEVGPGQTLSALARLAQSGNRPDAVIASCRKADEPDSDLAFALGAAGRLWASGQELDWDRIRPEGEVRKISLPTYAFERQRHWIEPGAKPARAGTETASPEISRIARLDDWFLVPDWRSTPLPPALGDRSRHCVVFAGQAPLGHALGKALAGRTVRVIRRGKSFGRCADSAWSIDPGSPDHYARLLSELERDGVRPDGIFYLWALDAEGTEQAEIFEPIFCLCQALQRHDGGTPVQLLVATSGTLALPAERVTHPARATLLGPCHAAAREIPLFQAQLVDLEDPAGAADAAAAQLISEFDGRARDELVAYRGNVRSVQVIGAAPLSDVAELPARLADGGVYVITGGLGGIGLELAQFLASAARTRLALIARREPDAEVLRRIRRIEQAGAQLLVLQADVADREQMRRALQSVEQRLGRVNGVFHAAGLLDDAPLAARTLEDTRRLMSPKVAGGAVLDALLPPGTIDLFAVFSSTSAIVGTPGQVDYIAANAYLDALAASRPDGLAIDWGVWRDVGMAAQRYRAPAPGLAGRLPLHPLLGAESSRSETEICFEAVLEPRETWAIEEHLVAGRPVLPGMAYIEIARAAMAAVRPGPVEIANLSLVVPLAFAHGEARLVRTTLTATPDGYDFAIQSQSLIDRGDWTAHAHARIRAAQPTAAQLAISTVPGTTEFGPAIRRPEPVQADMVSFGPRWQNLSIERLAPNGGVAEIELADRFVDDLSVYSFHPAMADIAATFGLALVKAVAGPGMVFLPMSVECVRLIAPLPRRFRSFCRLTRQVQNSFVTFDVVCTTLDGEPIAAFEGFTLRCTPAAAAPLPGAAGSRPPLQQILAAGILSAEAPSLFRRVLASSHRRIVVSSIALTDLRRVLVEESRRAAAPQRAAPAPRQKEPARYASDIEAQVASCWSELLGVERVSADDEFFALGGHSLAAVRLFAKIRKELGVDLPLASLYEARSLRQFAELVRSKQCRPAPAATAPGVGGSVSKAQLDDWSPLVAINHGNAAVMPFFCVHGGGGNVLTFTHLARSLGAARPFYGLQALGVDGQQRPFSEIEQMASSYLGALRTVQPEGPYVLGGYSGGGVIAFEMSRQLLEAGEQVALLVLFDSVSPVLANFGSASQQRWSAEYLLHRPARGVIRRVGRLLGHKTADDDLTTDGVERMRVLIRRHLERGEIIPEELRGIHLYDSYMKAQEHYRPTPLPIPILLFRATRQEKRFMGERWLGWERLSTRPIERRPVRSDHLGLMSARNAERMSAVLRKRLDEIGQAPADSMPRPSAPTVGSVADHRFGQWKKKMAFVPR